MKKILFLFLFFPLFGLSQTYHGSIAIPTDNSTSATSPLTFNSGAAPLSTMTTGDIAIVYVYARNATATFTNSVTGGQTWTAETVHQSSTATLSGQVFWCRFNGTWSAGPAFTFSSTTSTNAVMHIFRPTSTSKQWAKETSFSGGGAIHNVLSSFNAATTVTQNVGTFSPSHTCVQLAIWNTQDDNTWNTLSGTGWTQVTSPAAQFRNTSGNDVSSAYAYFISSSNTAAGISLDEATLGTDAGIMGVFYFYEFTASTRNANSDFFKLFNQPK